VWCAVSAIRAPERFAATAGNVAVSTKKLVLGEVVQHPPAYAVGDDLVERLLDLLGARHGSVLSRDG